MVIDADTRLVPAWLVGDRTGAATAQFVADLRSRLAAPRVQITTDANAPYLEAVGDAFGQRVDYAQLVKNYNAQPGQLWIRKTAIEGRPDPRHVSTSYVERQNLTMRMCMRRFTRQANGFRRLENLAHSVAIHFLHYNSVRIHGTLPATPAMEAGVSSRVWAIGDVVELVELVERNER